MHNLNNNLKNNLNNLSKVPQIRFLFHKAKILWINQNDFLGGGEDSEKSKFDKCLILFHKSNVSTGDIELSVAMDRWKSHLEIWQDISWTIQIAVSQIGIS